MINWEMIRKAKYLATTARSSRECVKAPMYCESQRIMIGRKKPKIAETAGGKIPEIMENVCGEEVFHSSKKSTYAVN